MNIPGFTAARALPQTSSSVVAADVPGGPGNVPVGYNRECQRLPMYVCTPAGCHIEYYWYCTYTPIARA